MECVTMFMFFLNFALLLLKTCVAHSEMPLLLLVSFDGFRYDYIEKAKEAGKTTPNFDSLISEGVKAKWIKNTFETNTFPNHFAIVTGHYEESHGVVANEMYDPVFNEVFEISNTNQVQDSKWFNNGTEGGGAEPIWVTNQKAPYTLLKRRTGVMMWPGSEAVLHGQRPYRYQTYNGSIANKTRINKIIEWFTTEEDPINLGLVYFNEPDHLGHQVGPNSPQVMQMIEELDGVVGYLIQKLKEHHLFNKINLIITSDHGMTYYNKTIELNKFISPDLYRFFGDEAVWSILPKEGKEKEVFETLKKVPNLIVYKKEEIPEEYHYTYNRRIMPIIIVAPEGYVLAQEITVNTTGGAHGYNNSLPSMHPFFIAHGPNFKKNYVSEPFNNIDIYPLMCELLEIKPYPNNGSLTNVLHLLSSEIEEAGLMQEIFNYTMITYILAVGFGACISGVFCIAACRIHRFVSHRRVVHVGLEKIAPSNKHMEGHTHLLAPSDEEEEIP